MSVYQPIRKYLLFLSLFFISLVLLHFTMLYLYEGSEVKPQIGGTVSVGFVGDLPSANPAAYGTDANNDYLLRFLFRSVLRFNVEKHEMEGDIATCDLGKDFSEIRCFLKKGNRWSDGTEITKADVLATYEFFRTFEGNKTVSAFLEGITIVDGGDYVTFKTKSADVMILDVFMIPIIKKDLIDKIRNNTYAPEDGAYSGDYVFDKFEYDDAHNVKRVSFVRNETQNTDDIRISRYVCKFFGDRAALLSSKDTLNIIVTPESLDLPPRFAKTNYLLPQYIALFLNSERLSNDLRNLIMFQLGRLAYPLDPANGETVDNPFLMEGKTIVPGKLSNKNVDDIFRAFGYFKKGELMTKAKDAAKPVVKPVEKPSENPKYLSIGRSAYFTQPSRDTVHFTTLASELLLSGKVDAGVDAVYVNEYKLQGFQAGQTQFYFRAKRAFGTLKFGANTYVLSFEKNGKKVRKDTLTVWNGETADAVAGYKKKYGIGVPVAKAPETSTGNTSTGSSESGSSAMSGSTATGAIMAGSGFSGTGEAVVATSTGIIPTAAVDSALAEKIKRIEQLDPLKYYDANYQPFVLKLAVTNQSPYIAPIAETIRDALKKTGIETEIIDFTQDHVQKAIRDGEKNYDAVVTGINLGSFEHNVSPFLHSGQAKNGFNFSKVKNPELDSLLEKIKSSSLRKETLQKLEEQVLAILMKENVILPIFSPYHAFYIDRNLRNVAKSRILPGTKSIYDLTEKAYIKEEYIMHLDDKSFSWLAKWVKETIASAY